MAIKIDIPGVGEVSVEGAAQESTMLEILAAVKQSEKTKQKAEKKVDTKAADEANKKLRETTSELDNVISGLSNLEEVATGSSKTMEYLERGVRATGTAALETTKGLVNFGASLTATAASVAVNLIKSFDDAAANPISAGAAMIDAGIDTALAVAKVTTNAVGGVASGLLGAIPVVGAGLQKVGEAATAAAIAVEEMGAKILHTGNELMAKEFQKTADSMSKFSRAGASFAGGMTEMRNLATASGIGLQQFTGVVSNSRDAITQMGLSSTDATTLLSGGLKKLSTMTGKSGNSMRDELLSLGYSFEEQGEIMAQYSASQRAAGNLRIQTDEELARGTASYAKDLKVLADITGKDAKKAMEEAQKVGQESDIMAQLTPKESEKFQKTYAAMPEYAKKGFLEYVSSGGRAITDATTSIMMSQNSKVGDLIKGSYSDLKNANIKAEDMTGATLNRASEASAEQLKLTKEAGSAIGQAARLGHIGGIVGDAAKMQTDIMVQGKFSKDTISKSIKAANSQAETTDDVTKGFVTATEALTAFQNDMEKIAGDSGALKIYADTIGKSAEGTARMVQAAIGIATKGWSAADAKNFIDTGKAPGEAGAEAAPKEGTAGDWMDKAGSALSGAKDWVASKFGGEGPSKKFGADVEKAIADASAETGVDAGYMRTMAKIESGGDPNAKNKSGAKGLYQFVPSTAKAYGLSGQEFDPKQAALAAAKMTIANKKQLEKSGVEATPEMLYMAHQQGAGGTSKLVKAARKNKGWDDLDAETQQNMASNAGKGMSPAEFISMWQKKYQKASEGGVGQPVEHQHVGQEGVVKAEIATKPKDAYTDTANLVGNAVQQKLSEIDNIQTSADQMSAHNKKQDESNNSVRTADSAMRNLDYNKLDEKAKEIGGAVQEKLDMVNGIQTSEQQRSSLIGKNNVVPEEPPHVQMIAAINNQTARIEKHLKHGNSQREVIKKQNA